MLSVGRKAPELDLVSTAGGTARLSDFAGKKVVLYFYPRDNTPGCTQEACDFRDNLSQLAGRGAVVLGVSKDSLASHHGFQEKYSLPFALLSDPDNRVAKAYGAYGEKSMYGRKIMGTLRSTFVIDEQGRVQAVWSPVKVPGHVEQVLAVIEGRQGAPAAAPARRAAKKTAKKPAHRKTRRS